MRRSAALVGTWREQQRRAAIARPVDTQGLGPRSEDDLLLIDSTGRAAGSLLGGTANDEAVVAARLLTTPSLRVIGTIRTRHTAFSSTASAART